MNAYRTPEAIDMTEVEIARIKETEETKRHALDLRAKEREDQRAKRHQWMSYDGSMAGMFILAVGVLGCGITITIMAAYAHWFIK